MEKYFQDKKSITGTNTEVALKIAERYMADNPVVPYTYRPFNSEGFLRDNSGRCIIDFDEKFPDAENGDYAYAFSKLYSDEDGICCLSISCRNPNEVYVNGEKVTSTTCLDEVLNEKRLFDFKVHKGYNSVFIKSKKNVLGFKCIIGCYSPKWLPVNFYTAFRENDGELGWNWCGVYKNDIFSDIPKPGDAMDEKWLPVPDKNDIYDSDGRMYAVSFMKTRETTKISCCIDVSYNVYVDGNLIECDKLLNIAEGTHKISIELEAAPEIFSAEAENASFFLPEYIRGVRGNWLYLESDDISARQGFDKYRLYNNGSEKEYFKTGKSSYLRPVLERPIFGKSNYPIGVALYGMLSTGRFTGHKEISDYAHEHIMQCCLIQDYAEWDCIRFGCACVNHQLLHLSALDDCGSFTSAVLEDYINYNKDNRAAHLINMVGDYILNKQERLADGTFYRDMKGEYFQFTVWADDLYMATPFLIRYSKFKKDSSIFDDAVNQFLCYRDMLFMPEQKLMSHVYNLKFKKQTGVPWGRGNGWVLFSLSELLLVMDKKHAKYESIKEFFIDLCEGILSCSDKQGMYHQLLDDESSFAEASCTAMCAAAFARGVRLGILPYDTYGAAAKKSVEALKEYCIDEDGNIYGTCCGSGYSFTREYYKYDLHWIKNDTHGTGIVLIAISETAAID